MIYQYYFPFVVLFAEGAGTSEQSYKFGGKELDRMYGLDWYDITDRKQNFSVLVFTTMGLMSEKYCEMSPYTYCMNNPIFLKRYA